MQKSLKTTFFAFASAILVACSNSVDPGDSGSGDIGKISVPAEETSSSGIPSSLTDPRDGQTYKVATIGTQVWMAENLNYEMSGSYCYKNAEKKCTEYGRLYKWESAQKACPTGWHLPTKAEFETLIEMTLSTLEDRCANCIAYTTYSSLISQSTKSGWSPFGTNSSGFTALPAGERFNDGTYSAEYQSRCAFWSSTEYDGGMESNAGTVYEMAIGGYHVGATLGPQQPDYALSVRCIYDEKIASATEKREVIVIPPCKNDSADNCEYSSLTDERDGQTYNTIKIGTLWWMAENLNYETSGSFCYNDADSNCTKYGRLYKWPAAMDSAGVFGTNGMGCGYDSLCAPTYPVRGICPKGWHLPDTTEWEILFSAVGGRHEASMALLSTTGWEDGSDYDRNGTDTYGFSIYPGGYRNRGEYSFESRRAYFWSSTERNENYAYKISMNNQAVSTPTENKYVCYSVRCIKD